MNMKNDDQLQMECDITHKALALMKEQAVKDNPDLMEETTPEPEAETMPTWDELMAQVEELKEYKGRNERLKQIDPLPLLSKEQQMRCVINAVSPFLDLIFHYGGKHYVISGLNELMSKYRYKRQI